MKLVKPSVEILAAYGHDQLPMTYDDPLKMIEFAGRTCYQSFDKAWDVCPECAGKGPRTIGCPVCDTGGFKNSAEKFVDMLDKLGHHAMLEHSWVVKRYNSKGNSFPSPFLYAHRFGIIAGNWRAFREAFRHPDNLESLEPGVIDSMRDEAADHPELLAMTARIVCDCGITHEIVRHRPASYAQESSRYCNYQGGVAFVIPPWCILGDGDWPRDELYDLDGYDVADVVWLKAMWDAEEAYLALLKKGWRPEQARDVLPKSLKTEIVITASLAEWQHIFKLRCAKAAHPQMREVMTPLRAQARKLYPGVFEEAAA